MKERAELSFQPKDHLEHLAKAGPFHLTEKEIRIEVQTSVEGPLSFVTTSPKLHPSKIQANIDLSADISQVQVSVDANSLEVISENISGADRRKILNAVADKILKIDQFPKIEFSSTVASIRASCHPFSVVVMGNLTINGVAKEIDLVFKHWNDDLTSQMSLLQSDFKIKPLSGMGGTLRCKDRIDLSIAISLKRFLNSQE